MSRPAKNELLRVITIAVILVMMGAAFAFAAGWLTPDRLEPGDIVDSLETHDGLHPGFRRAHAKGLCIEGFFTSYGGGSALSKAALFAPGTSHVSGRFSTGGGDPYAPDGRLTFHAMALSITAANGEVWRMAMDDTPMFLVATPQAFLEFQLATAPNPKTGKPDPQRTTDFIANHPETKAFMDWLASTPLPSSFANGTYYSINAFLFTNPAGRTRAVRWSFVPETPFEAIDKATLAHLPANFLFDDAIARLAKGPMRWHMMLTAAEPGDPVDDATKPWPQDRPSIDVGTLEIVRSSPEENGACRSITFDPLILPPGVSPSADPLLAARSAVYASSLARRNGEPPHPSAIAREQTPARIER